MFFNKNYKIFLHIIGCLIFLSLPVIFSPDFNTSFDLIRIHPFQRNFIAYVLILVFFYLNYYLLIPFFFFKKKYIIYTLLIILFFILIIYIPQLITGFPKPHFDPAIVDMPVGLQRHSPPPEHHFRFFGFLNFGPPVVQFLLVFILSLLLKMNARLNRAEKEKAIAELSYLKAQINPHFLFNSLNSIYAMALEKSDLAADAVIKLSGIMRYIINEADKDVVILQKEIEYVHDYIELQKFRLENTVQLTFKTEGSFDKHYIAPLLLIPFIENAFKYGVNPEEISVINIEIVNDDGKFLLKTFNKKVIFNVKENVTPKLGLNNTRKRLESLYPDKHKLEIIEDNTSYNVKLNINLT